VGKITDKLAINGQNFTRSTFPSAQECFLNTTKGYSPRTEPS